MLLVTLPFWLLVMLVVAFLIGAFIRAVRRAGWFGPTMIVFLLVFLVQGTFIPKAMWSVAWYLAPAARPLLEDVDFLLSRAQREEVVRRAEERVLLPSRRQYAADEAFQLPYGFGGLSLRGDVWVRQDACGTVVFFTVITGFSPDPYSGFEHVALGCEPELDPLESGNGRARLLGDGWYWIDAT